MAFVTPTLLAHKLLSACRVDSGYGPTSRTSPHHAGSRSGQEAGQGSSATTAPLQSSSKRRPLFFTQTWGCKERLPTPPARTGSRPPAIPVAPQSSWGQDIGVEGMGDSPRSQAPEKSLPHQQLRLPNPYPQRRARSGPALTQKTMLKPNRKYFPQQPTSGSWNCWCLPGMVSGHLLPREPEPGAGPALCRPPRPGAAPGLARWLRLHGQSHSVHRLPRPLWHRPRRSDRHTRSAVPSSDPALRQRSGPAHSVSPHSPQHGSVFLELRPRPVPVRFSPHGAPPTITTPPPAGLNPPKARPCLATVLQQPRPRPAQDSALANLFSSPASKPGPASDPP